MLTWTWHNQNTIIIHYNTAYNFFQKLVSVENVHCTDPKVANTGKYETSFNLARFCFVSFQKSNNFLIMLPFKKLYNVK